MHGGGLTRVTFHLQMLWDLHHRQWNSWSIPTDGFNLVRFKYATFKFYRHRSLSYIVYPEQIYCNNFFRGFGYYHPSKLIQESKHLVILSKNRSCNSRNYVKFKVRPPPTITNEWFLMALFAKTPLIHLYATFIDMEAPHVNPNPNRDGEPTIKLQVKTLANPAAAGNITIEAWNYFWTWDQGLLNGYIWTENDNQYPQKTYADALDKNIPYYISLFGMFEVPAGTPKLWIWGPANHMKTVGQRKWLGITLAQAKQMVQCGPFILKSMEVGASVNFNYKFKFQFGGPTVTEGYIAGTDPSKLPPGCLANTDTFTRRLQVMDLADHSRGVANDWDYRRGILTARGLQKLTSEIPLSTDELLSRWLSERRGPWLSEEETSSEEEEETTKKKKKKHHRQRHSL